MDSAGNAISPLLLFQLNGTTEKQLALLRPCDNALGPALLLVCLAFFISALCQSQYSSMSAELKSTELCKNKVILWTFLSITFREELHSLYDIALAGTYGLVECKSL